MRAVYFLRLKLKRIKVFSFTAFVCFMLLSIEVMPDVRDTVFFAQKNSESLREIINLVPHAAKRNAGNKTVVIIYTNQRSGSTFLGEIFNRNPNAFYLYEPLLPFTTNCDKLKMERLKLLYDLSECDFDNIRDAYSNAFKTTNYPDTVSQCINNTICFLSDQQVSLLDVYARVCSAALGSRANITSCGPPLKSKYLNQICREADFKVFKVLRICSFESLEALYSTLIRSGYSPYVVHLVRDPRAVMSSRLDIHLDGVNKANIGENAKLLCDRYSQNLKYAENLIPGYSHSFLTDGRYMRVRFEDVTFDTMSAAESIYRFIGKKMPTEVKTWIRKSHPDLQDAVKTAYDRAMEFVRLQSMGGHPADPIKEIVGSQRLNRIFYNARDPFATIRDPNEVLTRWRTVLPFDLVEKIQDECSNAMMKLKYRLFRSEYEMLNFNISYY